MQRLHNALFGTSGSCTDQAYKVEQFRVYVLSVCAEAAKRNNCNLWCLLTSHIGCSVLGLGWVL